MNKLSNPYGLPPRHSQTIDLREGDCPLSFTRDDFLRYAGPDQVIASALMFQMLTRVLSELPTDDLVDRNALKIQVGFPGPGVTDIIELVARGNTRNAANVSVVTEGLPMEAPEALIGRFYYEFEYEGHRLGIWPVDGYFTDEFRTMVKLFQPRKGDAVQQADYQRFKKDLVARLMARDPKDLFHVRKLA